MAVKLDGVLLIMRTSIGRGDVREMPAVLDKQYKYIGSQTAEYRRDKLHRRCTEDASSDLGNCGSELFIGNEFVSFRMSGRSERGSQFEQTDASEFRIAPPFGTHRVWEHACYKLILRCEDGSRVIKKLRGTRGSSVRRCSRTYDRPRASYSLFLPPPRTTKTHRYYNEHRPDNLQ